MQDWWRIGSDLDPREEASRVHGGHIRLFLVGLVVLTALKIVIAASLDLHWDEAYYWQAGQRLALGYADKPFMTALMVRGGTELFGDTLFGVRFLFLWVGVALPFAIYWLALPLVGQRDAILAGAASLVLPATALAGILAYQEATMWLFGLLALGFFERAMRTGSMMAWSLMGLAIALGMMTHYRFALFPISLFVYMLVTARGRGLWRRGGLWLAAGIAALGLLPILIFNFEVGFAGASQQLIGRHPWTFQIAGLRHPLEQATVVSPFLYAALLIVLYRAIGGARRGDERLGLIASFAAVPLVIGLLAGPWLDMDHTQTHWVASGYLPLLVLLPGMLRGIVAEGSTTRVRRVFAVLVPVGGALTVAATLAYGMVSAWPDTLFPTALHRHIRHEFQPWGQIAAPVRAVRKMLAEQQGRAANIALVGGNFLTSAELDFAVQPKGGVFTLDHPRNARNGVALQYWLWGLDATGLRKTRAGESVVVVIEDIDFLYHDEDEVTYLSRACAIFDNVIPKGNIELPGGRRSFRLYTARVKGLAKKTPKTPPLAACAFLPDAYLARPNRGSTVKGKRYVYGWAAGVGVGVKAVDLLVDGRVVLRLTYGGGIDFNQPGVYRVKPGLDDPNYPRIAFGGTWDSGTVPEGPHQVAIRIYHDDGTQRDFGERSIFVVHP